jgi:hypothetical protein
MLAAACALIRDLATGPARRAMFDRLAVHPGSLADQVEYENAPSETRPARRLRCADQMAHDWK